MTTLPFDVISDYCARWSTPVDEILTALERETHLKTLAPQMLSGAHQGKFLEMLSTLLSPERILEIGSFTGYSAICLARGLRPEGTLDALEMDPQYGTLFHQYIGKAGLEKAVTLHQGDALRILKTLAGPYDLIFIDAGKQEYPAYFEEVMPLLRTGGLILFDNMLWDGKVFGDTSDADAIVLKALARQLHADPRVECLLLPLRDGIMMCRKL